MQKPVERKVVCVAGMHRSGTSLLMSMLAACGVDVGESSVPAVGGKYDNPKGYWEHSGFRRLNDRLLCEAGGSWKAPPETGRDGWLRLLDLPCYRDEAAALVDSFASRPIWGWKDPRNCFTLPFWQGLIPDLRLVVIFRSPMAVALSMQQRRMTGNREFSVSFPDALALWDASYARLLAYADSIPGTLFVSHAALLVDPSAELARICDHLRLTPDPAAFGRGVSTIEAGLHRQSVSDRLLAYVDLPAGLLARYETLRHLAGVSGSNAADEVGPDRDTPLLMQRLVEAWGTVDRLRREPIDVWKQDYANQTPASIDDIDIVVVHYASIRATVAMLNALFRHYAEAHVTLVDNSGGASPAADGVLPHVSGEGRDIRLLVNPSTERGAISGRSHGAGIDFAVRRCERRYLLSMEPDTFVLERGCLEYLLALMDTGYRWAGLGQKPSDGFFASFSPSFAIFDAELLRRHSLSFRRRNRRTDERDPDAPLIRHHRQAAERVLAGMPLEYPEGKAPDTYRNRAEKIAAIELAHEDYFDTGETLHHELIRAGFRGFLFPPISGVCHTWGSRDDAIFLRNFRHNLPDCDLNQLLPESLQVATHLKPHSSIGLHLLSNDGTAPAAHWRWIAGKAGEISVCDGVLEIDVDCGQEGKVYLAMGSGGFDSPAEPALQATLLANAWCELACTCQKSGELGIHLWLIQYAQGRRLCHVSTAMLDGGETTLGFIADAAADSFRVLFRFSGAGRAHLSDLRLLMGHRSD